MGVKSLPTTSAYHNCGLSPTLCFQRTMVTPSSSPEDRSSTHWASYVTCIWVESPKRTRCILLLSTVLCGIIRHVSSPSSTQAHYYLLLQQYSPGQINPQHRSSIGSRTL